MSNILYKRRNKIRSDTFQIIVFTSGSSTLNLIDMYTDAHTYTRSITSPSDPCTRASNQHPLRALLNTSAQMKIQTHAQNFKVKCFKD